jgi:DNA-directed RNA polymerase subunit RPC12/RpoP
MKIVTCPKCGNSVQDEFVKRRNACPYCGLPASEVLGTAEPEAKKAPTKDSSPPQKAKPEPTAAAGAETYTCPECGAAITSPQITAKGMCPSCGCPAATIYGAKREQEDQERKENLAKEAAAAAALPKTPDDRYKTTASKLMDVFAWIIWIAGGIGSILLSIQTHTVGYYYTYTESYFNFVTFAIAAVSCFVSGAMFYAASKLLLDLHAVRVNLEQLSEKKEAQQ